MEISLLLTFPTSKGPGFRNSTATERGTDGSASPRRKIARLDTDSDIASSSRSKSKTLSSGPISIQVVTNDVPRHIIGNLERQHTQQIGFLRRCIQVVLTPSKGSMELLPNGMTYEKVFATCRSVVTVHNAGHELYEIFVQELERSMKALSDILIKSEDDDVGWIGLLTFYCKWFETRIALLKSLLTYLDQVYVAKTHVNTVHDQAYRLFSQQFFGAEKVANRLRKSVSTWLEWERDNEAPHEKRENVVDLVKYLTIHNQFNNFEQHYVDRTEAYYAKESEEDPRDEPERLFQRVQERIQEEQSRAEQVLPVGSWGVVRKVTEGALLHGRMDWLSKSLVPSLMDAKDYKTLGDMYALFKRVSGSESLEKVFQEYVLKKVTEIVKDTARDEEMVPRLLEVKAQADETLSTSFLVTPSAPTTGSSTPPKQKKDQTFVYALDNAFTYGFRARRSKPAEMIAKHLHQLLRKGQGALTGEEYQAKLDAALALYRFSEDKDVFRTFYHRSLAKRLLVGNSASDDMEASMLKTLTKKYDPEFGLGEEMFKDLAVSKDLMRDYLAKKDKDSPAHRLNVVVLQQSAWPFSVPKQHVDLPPKMQDELTHYTNYYKSEHGGRALVWDHALGTATLKADFKNGAKELSVSLYQGIVLLLFNEEPEIGFVDIRQRVGMDDAELRRTMQSLACGKKKVLKKIPPGRDVNDGDKFRFNADFEDPHARVHINSIQAKVTPEESQKTNESIEGDRKHFLDAAIVRIMKGKKEATYEEIKTATINAMKSHFVPTVDSIKKRIDSLVESEYLRRSDGDRHLFFYVA